MLLVLRALFGIAMGGEWGVGAALTFETLPKEGRGALFGHFAGGLRLRIDSGVGGIRTLLSSDRMAGVVHSGRNAGAACVLCAGARAGVSGVAGRRRVHRKIKRTGGLIPPHLAKFLPTFLFLVLLMTAFMSFSHGTQDVYPTFLTVQMKLSPRTVGLIGVLYGFGSIRGGYVLARSRRSGVASARS